jgi:hypothetical protein
MISGKQRRFTVAMAALQQWHRESIEKRQKKRRRLNHDRLN